MKIVLASNNKHKIKEFKDILKGIEILSLNDIGFNDDIIEDGESFTVNYDNIISFVKEVNEYCDKITEDSLMDLIKDMNIETI